MPPTLLGLKINSSTVDHFRRNVYRPRLCLLLLVLVLSPHNVKLVAQTPNDSTVQPLSNYEFSTQAWTISMIDGLVVAAPAAGHATPPRASDSPLVQRSSDKFASSAVAHPSQTPAFATPTPATLSSSTRKHTDPAQTTNPHNQPAPGSLFKLPKPSWGLLIDSHVLPVALSLHLLWAIRFLSMAIEDTVVCGSLVPSPSHVYSAALVSLIQLSALFAFTLFIASPFATESIALWCAQKRAAMGLDVSADTPSLLPLNLFVFLEMLTVLVSLISVVFKVQHPWLAFLPKTLRLPSPSHLPSVLGLLPLPPQIAAVFTAMSPGSFASNRSRRRLVTSAETETNHNSTQTEPSRSPQQQVNPAQMTRTTHSSRRQKAPRIRGQTVIVSTKWLSETFVSLFDKAIGSFLYAIVTIRLPTLSPTSLPPVLSLLSLRSELSSLTTVWSRARNSLECLEFVRLKWGIELSINEDPYLYKGNLKQYTWKFYEQVICSICFEPTRPVFDLSKSCFSSSSSTTNTTTTTTTTTSFQFCRLDCGHELHDTCLVSWLTAQTFCPVCHQVFSFPSFSSNHTQFS